jgi:hypothetical protein
MQSFKYGKITVVCEAENTRNGFRHIATLLLNGQERNKAKACYINRTWESFRFQTVMQILMDKSTECLTKRQIANFRKKILCR